MPRFYFDTYDGEKFHQDESGMNLESLQAVKNEAQRALPDMAREVLPDGDHRTFIVSVRNENGGVVLRAALSLIVEEGNSEA